MKLVLLKELLHLLQRPLALLELGPGGRQLAVLAELLVVGLTDPGALRDGRGLGEDNCFRFDPHWLLLHLLDVLEFFLELWW